MRDFRRNFLQLKMRWCSNFEYFSKEIEVFAQTPVSQYYEKVTDNNTAE
jgi:hypothetical protein